MTPHNEAKPGDYAETVLLPGDPLRAKWIAGTFLEDARQINGVRGCLGFTGHYRGQKVSVQATGMGQPSLGIYVHELINVYGVRNLIRVGTCGGLNETVKVRDIVIAQGACTDSATVGNAFPGYSFAPIADFGLLRTSVEKAEEAGARHHVGNILSSDVFYREGGIGDYLGLPRHGVLAVEMEAAVLYLLAARFGAKALAICTMTDCILTKAELPAADRQSSLVTMMDIALETALAA